MPSCWEEIEKDYDGVAFYRRTFAVPAEWQGAVVRLHFDAVNFQAEVWLNDQAVGFHEGGFTPFDFRVEKIIRPGQPNTLTVRVAGPILLEEKRIEGVGPMETPQWRGAITGGIWQAVRLVATADVYYDWYPEYDLSRRHYYGPGDTWWGSDLAVVRLGSGRCVLSQLRIVENLGRDPVADRILFNLIEWATRTTGN